MTTESAERIEDGRIWTRYHNVKFVVVVASILCVIGFFALRIAPAIGVFIELLAALFAYCIWMRYLAAVCPSCGNRFASFWGKFIFGFLKPTKCQSCGLPAGNDPG